MGGSAAAGASGRVPCRIAECGSLSGSLHLVAKSAIVVATRQRREGTPQRVGVTAMGAARPVQNQFGIDALDSRNPRPSPASDERTVQRIPKPNLFKLYRPIFEGQRIALASMAFSSFVAGASEAAMLVVIANLALSVGSARDGGSPLQGLGPIDSLSLSLSTSFVVAMVLAFIRFTFQMLSAQLTARLTADLTASARAGTFADFADASWAEQSRREEADIQDLLVRHVNRTTSAISTMAGAINGAFMLAALLLSAFILDTAGAVLLVVVGGGLFFAIRPLSRYAKRVSTEQQMAGLEYGTRALEIIGTSMEVRAFGVTQPVAERLARATKVEVRPTYLGIILRQLVSSLYQLITILLVVGGLIAVNSFVNRPLASLGATVIILVRALNQSGALQAAYHSMTETAPYLERLNSERASFRAARPTSGEVRVTNLGTLTMEQVSYSYSEGRPALKNINLEIATGEAIGIIGPSGSGKSTLVQILLRLRDPDTGSFMVNGVEASTVDDASWFSQTAFVPQESNLINDTVAANIAFYRDATLEDIVRAARRAHVHDEIMRMPNGYETVLGRRGGALSGGQQQRVSIARALLRQPSILVLDEPTSALDMRSESLVHETFTELKGSVTIVAIAHRLSTLNECDRIIVMSGGRIQAFGTRAELEESSTFYRDAIKLSQIRG